MIDRYTIYSNSDLLEVRFNVEAEGSYEVEYNAGPTKKMPVIANTASGGLSHFYWGAISKWSNNKSISNRLIVADKEQLTSKPSLKNNLIAKRCIVPANGFYMWKKVGKKSKRPYYFTLKNQEILGLAALWENYDDMDGKVHHTFKLIVTENRTGLPEFGEIMPVILRMEHEHIWLKNNLEVNDWLDILNPIEGSGMLNFHCVSPNISKLTNNYPELINPQPSVDQLGNYTLFE